MTFLYRFLSLIIYIVAALMAFSLLGSLGMLFSSFQNMSSLFLMLACILYAFFSFRFQRQVLQKQQTVSHRLRDWLRVNGIVSMVFSILISVSIIFLLINPEPFVEALKNYGIELPLKTAVNFFIGMLVYSLILLIHVLWTFALMRKYKEFFL